MPQSKTYKVLLIGDAKSGKTHFLERMISNEYSSHYIPTVGVVSKSLRTVNGLILRIWDTAGDEELSQFTKSFYRNADLFIYCIDFSSKIDQAKIEEQIQECRAYSPEAALIILATQMDKPEYNHPPSITVDKEEIKILPISTKRNLNTQQVFYYLERWASDLYMRRKNRLSDARCKLITAFDTLPDNKKTKATEALDLLEEKLGKESITEEDKAQALLTFNNHCASLLKNDHPSTFKLVSELIAILAIPVLVGLIGFGVGFALGLWTGPGAFLSGIIAGQAAAVAAVAITGASTLGSAGLGYYFFKPSPTPTPAVVTEFAAATRDCFKVG